MPVPKRKRSRSRRDKRFANKGMAIHAITACNNCTAPIMPHVICKSCGFYKGTKILRTKNDRTAGRVIMRQSIRAQQVQAPTIAAQEA